jgi:hypothetical protein
MVSGGSFTLRSFLDDECLDGEQSLAVDRHPRRSPVALLLPTIAFGLLIYIIHSAIVPHQNVPG